MKTIRGILIAIIVLGGADLARGADVTAQTGFQLDWWKDSSKNVGYQGIIPLKVSTQMQNLSASILGGYAYTSYDPNSGDSSSLSHTLDSKVNLTYEILDKLPFDVLLGFDVNLPTGKTNLQQKDLSLLMDPDLVTITRFGEGYNFNPTVTAAKEWGNWVAGLGVGYVWRMKYDFTTDLHNYDPGDIFTTTGEIRYDFSPFWTARLFGQYAHYGKDQVQNQDYYQEGDFYLAGAGLRHSQKKWNAAFTLRYLYRGKSQFQDTAGTLATPNHNNYGNEWIADLLARYLLTEEMTLWTRLQGLYIKANDFPSNSSFFVGRREKISLELGGKKSFGELFDAGLTVKGFYMDDEASQYPVSKGDTSYRGFSVMGNLTARF
jgi:hypothetical protein